MTIDKEVLLNKQYNTATAYCNRVALLDYAEPAFNMWQWAAEQYSFVQANSILEVGCGTGGFWRYAAAKLSPNHQITLTDISEGMLKNTKNTLQEFPLPCAVHFQIADVEKLVFEDNSFDQVIAHLMLYHTQSPMQALTEIKRVLKPNGYVGILTFSNKSCEEIYIAANKVDARIPAYPYIIGRFSEQIADELLPRVFSHIQKRRHTVTVKIPHPEPLLSSIKTHFIVHDYNLDSDFFIRYNQEIQKTIDEKGVFTMDYEYIFYVCTK